MIGLIGQIRSMAFNLSFYSFSFLLGFVGTPILVFGSRSQAQALARVWTATSFWLMRWVLGLHCEVRGIENLPKGPCVVASKHQSAWETLIMHQILPDPVFILKKSLFSIPFVGWFMKKSGAVGIDRSKGTQALRLMLDEAGKALEQGSQVVIFPEGTRTPPGQLKAYHPGVAMLYDRFDAPLVPVAVNSGVFWGRNAVSKKPGLAIVEVMPPIEHGLKRKVFMKQLQDTVDAASLALCQEAGWTPPPQIEDQTPPKA